MNGFCKTLSAFFGPQQLTDCPSDGWRAIKVYLDGNEIEIGGPFATEEEAEECAVQVHQQELADNGQFGGGRMMADPDCIHPWPNGSVCAACGKPWRDCGLGTFSGDFVHLMADAMCSTFKKMTGRDASDQLHMSLVAAIQDDDRAPDEVNSMTDQCAENTDTRTCTCPPDDSPPVPCPRKYALTECRTAAALTSRSGPST